MENQVLEVVKKERKVKTNNLSNKSSIRKYVSESVDYYSTVTLSEQDKAELCNTLENYTIDYIKDEAKRLTYNYQCIKNGRQDKIKVKANMIDVCYATGFVVTFILCFFSGVF